MRLAALALLIIGNLFTTQVHAEDALTQPLTRADCEKAQMAWDENANVCLAGSGGLTDQPLTRLDCTQARLAWDDSANRCGTSHEMRDISCSGGGGVGGAGCFNPAPNEK